MWNVCTKLDRTTHASELCVPLLQAIHRERSMCLDSFLKGSYDDDKNNIIWCNAMFMRFKVQKTHYFPHTVRYCCSFLPSISETCQFLQSSSFWKARCALIGQLSSVLWLAEYLKHVKEMLCPLPYLEAQYLHNMAVVATILQWE